VVCRTSLIWRESLGLRFLNIISTKKLCKNCPCKMLQQSDPYSQKQPPWREFNCLIKLHFSLILPGSLLPKGSYSQSLQLIPTSNQPSTTRSKTVSKCHIFAKEEKRKSTARNFLEQFGTSLSFCASFNHSSS
jgi:hypothetical protein